MTKDDIIRMAREAGGYVAELPNGDAWLLDDAVVKRFAALVAAHEREACAQLVENYALQYAEPVWALKLTEAIRAKGQA